MPASPVPVLFSGSGIVQLAKQYGASIIALLNESSGTVFADYSGNGVSITGPASHITYGNPTVAQGISQSVGYDGAQTGQIVAPARSAGSFSVVQFFRVSSSISITSNFPILSGTTSVPFVNQGYDIRLFASSAAPWQLVFEIGYSASAQSGNTIYTNVFSSAIVQPNIDYVLAATYNSATNAMNLYLRAAGAGAATNVASTTAGGTMVAAATSMVFGDGVTYNSSHFLGSVGPGLYFQGVELSAAQVNALTRFVV